MGSRAGNQQPNRCPRTGTIKYYQEMFKAVIEQGSHQRGSYVYSNGELYRRVDQGMQDFQSDLTRCMLDEKD